MFIPFLDDFTPDAGDYQGGANSGFFGGPKGVINIGKGYAPFLGYSGLTTVTGLGETALGLFSMMASNSSYYTIAGGATKLQRVNGTGWEDVSRTVGGAYAVANGDRWNFAAFGDRIIGVDFTDATQTYLAGTDTDFSALAATCPKAKYIDVAGDFVILGYINDGAVKPFHVAWSAAGDPTLAWTASSTTLAGQAYVDSNYGVITGVAGHANGFYVFQRRGITPFYYTGSPLVFTRGKTIAGIGCDVPPSLLKAGGFMFFLSTDGWKKFDGSTVTHIGIGRVDSTIFSNYLASDEQYVSVFADPQYPVVYLPVPGSSIQRNLISYNYVTDRFTWILLDTFYYNLGIHYSSTYPKGTIAGFKVTDGKLGAFAGTAYAASFYTNIIPASEAGGKGTISRVRVRCETAAPDTVFLRTFLTDTLTSDANTAMTAVGNNNQYTKQVVESIACGVTAVYNAWSTSYKAYGVDLLEHTLGDVRTGNKR